MDTPETTHLPTMPESLVTFFEQHPEINADQAGIYALYGFMPKSRPFHFIDVHSYPGSRVEQPAETTQVAIRLMIETQDTADRIEDLLEQYFDGQLDVDSLQAEAAKELPSAKLLGILEQKGYNPFHEDAENEGKPSGTYQRVVAVDEATEAIQDAIDTLMWLGNT